MKRPKLIEYRGNKSQAEMGKLYGVTQQAWSSWENGDTSPNVVIMRKIEKDSGIAMEVIFFDIFNKN